MPSIDIKANVNVTGGGSAPGKPGSAPVQNADAAAKLAAAQREATKATGKAYSPEQMKIAADYFKEMSKSRNLLKSYNGDLERFIRDFRNNQPSSAHGQKQFNSYMQQIGLGGAGQPGGGVGGMVKQAVMSVFRATGMGGGASARIMAQGYHQAQDSDGGMGSAGGMGMLAKGAGIAALAYAGIKTVQKVSQKVGEAQDEAIGYHDLREKVGGAAVGFEELRAAVKYFSQGLGTTNDEQRKLARSYAESSQVFGAGTDKTTGLAVGQGTQLSRGFGLDPSDGVGFLAAMKHFKAADGSEKDNRKLAYLIGDAVGKTGAFSKADDVMNAIAHFTESTARQSMQTANVEGFSSMLGALGGLKLPGMDANGAASLMQRLSGSWASGGGGGEASHAMRLGWAQRFGATAFDTPAIDAAGPMASAQSTYGKDSPYYQAARTDAERARLLEMANKGGDKTFLSQEMGFISGQYGDRALPHALMTQYGLNHAQASVLSRAHADGGIDRMQGDVAEALKGSGKDPSSIGLAQMSKLAMISYGSRKDLDAMSGQARKLTGNQALSKEERSMLDGASDDRSLKKALTKIFATRETEDDGKSARLAQVNLDNQFTDFARKIIPLTTAIQEGIFRFVDKMPGIGGLTPEMKKFQRDQKLAAELEKHKDADGDSAETKAKKEQIRSAIAKESAEANRLEDRSPREVRTELEASRKALAKHFMSVPVAGNLPRNLRNNNPGNIEYGAFAKEHGATGSDGRFAIFPDKASGSAAMDALLQKYSKKDGLNTVSGIVGKWAPPTENDTSAYAKSVAKRMGVTADQTLDMSDPKISAAMAREMARIEGSADAYTDKQLPQAARSHGAGGQAATVSGSARVLLQLPGGKTQDVDVPLLGGFRQTYAGEAR